MKSSSIKKNRFENWRGIIWKKTRVLKIMWKLQFQKLEFWKIVLEWNFGKLNLKIEILENYFENGISEKLIWKLKFWKIEFWELKFCKLNLQIEI